MLIKNSEKQSFLFEERVFIQHLDVLLLMLGSFHFHHMIAN